MLSLVPGGRMRRDIGQAEQLGGSPARGLGPAVIAPGRRRPRALLSREAGEPGGGATGEEGPI